MRELCAAACKAVGLRAYARGYAYLRLSAQIQLRFGASYVPPSASIRLARIRSRRELCAAVCKHPACAHTLAATPICAYRRKYGSAHAPWRRGNQAKLHIAVT